MKKPRFGLPLVCAALLSPLAAGCVVPQNRYDEVSAKLHEEEALRRKSEAELARLSADIVRLSQALDGKEQSLLAREGDLANAQLEAERISREKTDAVELVEQLRGELSRVGEHLREYSGRKQELEAALGRAEARAKELEAAERGIASKVLVMRDVSLALAEPAAAGKVVITTVEGKPTVRFDAREVFSGKGTELKSDMVAALERIALAVAPRGEVHLELSDLSAEAATPEDRIARLERVADLFSGKGIGFERLGFAVTPAPEAPVGPSPSTAEPAKKTAPGWRDGPGSLQIVVGAPRASQT
jgi:hypothetical protein